MHPKQYSTVLDLPSLQRYEYFIEKIASFQRIWILCRGERMARLTDPQGVELYPVWPEKKFAEACLIREWTDYQPKAVPLTVFADEWVPMMKDHHRQLLIFSTPKDMGVPIGPEEILQDIRTEMNHGS